MTKKDLNNQWLQLSLSRIGRLRQLEEGYSKKLKTVKRQREALQRAIDQSGLSVVERGESTNTASSGLNPRRSAPLTDAIRTILVEADGPMQAADIKNKIIQSGLHPGKTSVAVILARLVQKGFVEKRGYGQYEAKRTHD